MYYCSWQQSISLAVQRRRLCPKMVPIPSLKPPKLWFHTSECSYSVFISAERHNMTHSVKLVSVTQGAAELLGKSAQELVAYTARVSNPTNQMNSETAPRLLA